MIHSRVRVVARSVEEWSGGSGVTAIDSLPSSLDFHSNRSMDGNLLCRCGQVRVLFKPYVDCREVNFVFTDVLRPT